MQNKMDAYFKKFQLLLITTVLIVVISGSCKSPENCNGEKQPGLVTGPNGPRKVYVPEYFVYRNGRYEFVKGHYRWILNRKTYLKRTTRGYTERAEGAASIR